MVLLAEDDSAIADPLSRALHREGYDVQVVVDGPSAFDTASTGAVDVLVLDLGLPGMDGLDVCRRLRAAGRSIPVLMLTARADEVDFVVGLDAGADDYVAKPFRLAELLARIRALLRRQAPGTVDVSGVKMDLAARLVTVDGEEVTLANKEFELLRVLIQRAGQVVTREEILAEVWNGPELKTTKTLDMHMSWLRRKLGEGGPRAPSGGSPPCAASASASTRSSGCVGGSCWPSCSPSRSPRARWACRSGTRALQVVESLTREDLAARAQQIAITLDEELGDGRRRST